MSEWEWVPGYENGQYTDNMVFKIDPDTKKIEEITKQPLVSGEELSQFIRFEMPRYYDGIDLSTKNIQIIYITEEEYSDINIAVCVERNDEMIRFGWIVPAAAVYETGILSFSVEFVGDSYTLKSRATEIEVFDGLNGGGIIPEPTEKAWYIELQQRCDFILDKAKEYMDAAEDSAAAASNSEALALDYKSQAENSKNSASSSASGAAASAQTAQDYAELASNVFKVAGNASFSVDNDGAVHLIFTEEDE